MTENGAWSVRIVTEKGLHDVVKRVGEAHMASGVSKIKDPAVHGLWLLLRKISQLFEEGDVSWLHDRDFEQAIQQLKGLNFGKIEDGGIDINLLHRTKKMKSGFEGVYATNGGFRAQATHAGVQKVVGTFKTAEEAAHRRRLYYAAHDLPYGELEFEMAKWRSKYDDAKSMDDLTLIRAIDRHAREVNTWEQIFGEGTGTIVPKGALDDVEPVQPLVGKWLGFPDGYEPPV